MMAETRPRYASSAFPNHSSKVRIWWLIAVWVTERSSAARVKLSNRAADSNARNALSGGRERVT